MSQFYVYLTLALWTTWALLSNYLAVRLPAWTVIFCGGFASIACMGGMLVAKPAAVQWPSFWLLVLILTSTVCSIVGGYTYLAALGRLTPAYVTPVTHLYLVLAPVLYLLAQGRYPTRLETLGLVLVSLGIICFLTGNVSEAPIPTAVAQDGTQSSK